MDYTKFINKITSKRQPSAIRQIWEEVNDGMDKYLVLAGGLPPSEMFPFRSGKLTLRDGSELNMTEEMTATAMQYGRTSGLTELRDWILCLVEKLHDPPTLHVKGQPHSLDVVIGNGSQDCLYKVLEAIVEEGDIVVTESPVYSGFLSVARPFGAEIVSFDCDDGGVIIEQLSDFLSKNKNKRIKAFYCVPNGGNPSGVRYSEQRKREIYKLAQEYDFMIIEDDAYYFLEKDPRNPTFLSLDTDGRVFRLDTFSKTVAPGLRMGFLCGPAEITDRILMALQASSQGTSGVTQLILYLFCTKLGHDGFLEHCRKVANFYDKKRNTCIELANKHLKGLAEWKAPTGGMFMWIRLLGMEDNRDFIINRLRHRKILMMPGCAFMVDEDAPCPFIRISFAPPTVEQIDQAFKVLAEEWRACLQTEQ